MTQFYQFIISLKDEDSEFGDLANAVIQDDLFPKMEREENQMVYLNNIKPLCEPHVGYVIDQLFKMYNAHIDRYGKQ